MTELEKAARMALEAWQTSSYGQPSHQKLMVLAMTAMQQALANEALERMADNARELGLDYEPAQDDPCPGCRKGVVCRTPKCGRLKLPVYHPFRSQQPAPVPEAHEQEPVVWMPIEQMYPQGKAIDILMGDGSILCAVLPQFDGDLWWEGSGTGEKFIDPKYANVTHWRINGETRPQAREWVGLTDEEQTQVAWSCGAMSADWLDFARAIEAKLKEKNT